MCFSNSVSRPNAAASELTSLRGPSDCQETGAPAKAPRCCSKVPHDWAHTSGVSRSEDAPPLGDESLAYRHEQHGDRCPAGGFGEYAARPECLRAKSPVHGHDHQPGAHSVGGTHDFGCRVPTGGLNCDMECRGASDVGCSCKYVSIAPWSRSSAARIEPASSSNGSGKSESPKSKPPRVR